MNEEETRKAIALEYDGVDSPRVNAAGEGDLADKILAIATEHDIPIYRDEALLTLLASLPLHEEIPPTLYVAVAEIFAFIYQMEDLLWVDREGNPVDAP